MNAPTPRPIALSCALALSLALAPARDAGAAPLPAGTGGLGGTGAGEAPVRVGTVEELRAAAATAGPGTRIEIAPGTYRGGLQLEGLRGAEGRPIILTGADPERPPLFQGGGSGLHLVRPAHVELRDIAIAGASGNGLNVDDGGKVEEPARDIALLRIRVRDVGPRGNRDGIKLSGVEGFRLEGCLVESWGSGGSAVDMVGCRQGRIVDSTFRRPAEEPGASGVQAKGGSRDIVIQRCRFERAGGRAVNIGGSTGPEYFRPPLASWKGERFEAKDIRVEGCTFLGSQTPVAFVGADGGAFRFNTVHVPGRWALRILQETREEGFVACRRGEFTDNIVVFRSGGWSEGGVNVGGGTDAASFRFARNFWLCEDAPGRTRSLVRLPAKEEGGVHGEDPRFRDAARGDLRLEEGSLATGRGAEALAAP